MAKKYVETIANLVANFDEKRLDFSIYKDISWVGLRKNDRGLDTKAWASISSKDKAKIMQNIEKYFSNGKKNCN